MTGLPTLFTDEEFEEVLANMPAEPPPFGLTKPEPITVRIQNARAVLEVSFKRILDKIDLLWGSPECEHYFSSLVTTDPTRGQRQGFPPEVMAAILLLHNFHASEFVFDDKDDHYGLR